MKLEEKKGLQLIVDKSLRHGRLVPGQSLCHTLILPVVKPDGEYRLVPDHRAVNHVVAPIHPLVASPYNALTQIPVDTTWFSVSISRMPLSASQFIPLHETCLPSSGLILTQP